MDFFGEVPVGERGDAPVREGDVEIHGVVPFFEVDISERLSSENVASFSFREYDFGWSCIQTGMTKCYLVGSMDHDVAWVDILSTCQWLED